MAKPSVPSGTDLSILASKDIWSYVKTVKDSPEFTNLTSEKKKEALDYVYNERVVPFFKSRGESAPARESLESTSRFSTAFAEPSKLDRFGVGVAQGAAKTLAGAQNISTTITAKLFHVIGEDEAATKVENARDKVNKLLLSPTHDWFDTYQPKSMGEEFAGLGGEIASQIPVFNAVGSVLKSVPIIGQAAVGGVAVPLSVGKWIPPLRTIVASQVLQKSLFGALEGAATAPLVSDDPKAWASFGAASPVVFKGLGILSKPVFALFSMAGVKGVAGITEAAQKLASLKRAARPTPGSAEEALKSSLADGFDKVAKDNTGKVYSDLGPEARKKVDVEVLNHITDWVKHPDPETVGEMASTETELVQNASPKAQATASKIDAIASKFGIPTTKEAAAAKAKKDTVRATIVEKVKSSPISETTSESRDTLASQLDSVKANIKPALVTTKDKVSSLAAIPDNLKVQNFQDGTSVIFNPKQIEANKVKELKLKNRINEVIDYKRSKEQVAKAVKDGEEPVVIKAQDASTGLEHETVLASSSSAVETAEAVQKHFPQSEVSASGIEGGAEVTKARALSTLKHDYANIVDAKVNSAYMGREYKSDEVKLALIRKAATDAGLSDSEIQTEFDKLNTTADQMISHQGTVKDAQKIVDAEEKAAKSVKKTEKAKAVSVSNVSAGGLSEEDQKTLDAAKGILGTKTTAWPDTTIDNKAMDQARKELGDKSDISKLLQRAQEIKTQLQNPQINSIQEGLAKAKATIAKSNMNSAILKHEATDSDIPESRYRQILGSYGFKSSKDVPPEAVDTVRAAILKDRFHAQPMFLKSGNIFTTEPASEAEKVLLKPSKVLDIDSSYNPIFIGELSKDFPDLLTQVNDTGKSVTYKDAVDAYQKLQVKLGPDKAEQWLKDKGYDAVVQGRPKNGDWIAQVLNPDIIHTTAKKEVQTATSVAKAAGVPERITDNAAKAAKQAEEVTRPEIKKYDMSGKLIKPNQEVK